LSKKKILLLTHGQYEEYFLETIAEDVMRTFHHPVSLEECRTDLSDFYDPTRRQYDANRLLKHLQYYASPDTIKIMGLCSVDLFIPILTFIFGQAIFKGDVGIASVYRLKNEQYGIKSDDDLILDRFRKIVIHELGHTFGLVHCFTPSCVMRISTYVEDIDQKKMQFCNICREKLESAFKAT
jgi:archaemetzincin